MTAPALCPFRPPGVLIALLVDFAETVNAADFIKQPVQPCPLMGQESGNIEFVITGTGIGDMMGRLKIRADNKLTPFTQGLLHMETEGFHKIIFMIQYGEVILTQHFIFPAQRRGRQYAGHADFVKIGLDKAAFAIGLFAGKPIHDGLREVAGVNSHASVLVVFTIDEVGFVTVWNEAAIFNFIGTHTVILNANNVCILLGQPVKKALVDGLSQTINADRNYPHTCSLIRFECMIPVLYVNKRTTPARSLSMQDYQHDFIKFAISRDVLRFGEFTLKSGRASPYFFNAGLFNTGDDLLQLSKAYAAALKRSGLNYDIIFGPAYKGIPLATATAMALAAQGDNRPYAFNRKEHKDHGEGGNIVGAPLAGKVLVVDDVITAGTAIRESIDLIKSAGAEPAGVLIALDRQERGRGELSAIQEMESEFNIPVISIIRLEQVLGYLQSQAGYDQHARNVAQYRETYGV